MTPRQKAKGIRVRAKLAQRARLRVDSDPTRFGYARLTFHQRCALLKAVRGKVVWDLGAGSGELAAFMAQSAAHVHAVDKDEHILAPMDLRRVTYHRARFTDPEFMTTLPLPDVIVTSWLVNNTSTVVEVARLLSGLLERRPLTYIWIGINDSFTACGGIDLEYLVRVWDWAEVHEFPRQHGGASDLGIYTTVRTEKSPKPGCAPRPSLPLGDIS